MHSVTAIVPFINNPMTKYILSPVGVEGADGRPTHPRQEYCWSDLIFEPRANNVEQDGRVSDSKVFALDLGENITLSIGGPLKTKRRHRDSGS